MPDFMTVNKSEWDKLQARVDELVEVLRQRNVMLTQRNNSIVRLRAALRDKFIAGYLACYERRVDEGCCEYEDAVIAEAKAVLKGADDE